MSAVVQGTLFHQPVTRPRGNALLPLSQLRDRYPDLYELHVRKHRHRPDVLTAPVKPLHCAWADLVFLSPVHPAPLFHALGIALGAVPWTLDAAELDTGRAVIRLMRHGKDGHYPDPADENDYLPLTTATLRAVNRVTYAALDRLGNLQPGDPVLPWVDVPHVLYRGSIPFNAFIRPGENPPPPCSRQ